MDNRRVIMAGIAAIFSRRATSRGGRVIVGMVYALVVFFVMWYVVVPAVDPVMLNLNAPVFAIAHIMWGVAIGLFRPQAAAAAGRARG